MQTLTKGKCLISNKVAFKERSTVQDQEGYFIITIGSVEQDDITTLNLFKWNFLGFFLYFSIYF